MEYKDTVDCSDGLDIYLNDVANNVLSKEELNQLLIDGKNGDYEAMCKYINAHLRFVIQCAKRYKDRGLDFEDLIQEGNIGLVESFYKYDINYGTTFLSYASVIISYRIEKALKEKSQTIRVPLYLWDILNRVKKVRVESILKNGCELSLEDVAQKTNLTEEEVKKLDIINNYISYVDSIDKKIYGESDSSLENFIVSENPTLEDKIMQNALQEEVQELLDCYLSQREKEVIKYRFGFYGEIKSQPEIADIYGVTKQAIQYTEKKALRKLRGSRKCELLKDFV